MAKWNQQAFDRRYDRVWSHIPAQLSNADLIDHTFGLIDSCADFGSLSCDKSACKRKNSAMRELRKRVRSIAALRRENAELRAAIETLKQELRNEGVLGI